MSDDVKKTEISKEVISPVKPGAKLADESETKPSTNPFATPTVKPGAAGTSAPGALSTKPMKFKKKLGKGKRKKRRRIIIAIVVVLVLALLVFMLPSLFGGGRNDANANAIYSGDITSVKRSDVTKTVSLNGTLESSKSMAIYTTLNSPVTALKVRAGDAVTTGQVLAQLDTDATVKEIASQQAAMQDAQVSKQNAINQAQDTYQNFADSLASGTNPEINAAKKGIKTAQAEYQKAQKTFETLKTDRATKITDSLVTQEAALRTAYQEVEKTRMSASRIGAALKEADRMRDLESISLASDKADLALRQKELQKAQNDSSLSKEKKAEVINALQWEINHLTEVIAEGEAKTQAVKEKYDTAWSQEKENKLKIRQATENLGMARRQYRLALLKVDRELADAQDAVARAQDGILDANAGLQQAEAAAQLQNRTNQRAIETARSGATNAQGQQAIAKLRADINSATVRAPMTGVITSVTAKVGSPAQGALFMVEDNQNLLVKTAVKEKDVSKLSVGQQVTFKTPATGDKKYTGTVTFISPAASRDLAGGGDGNNSSGGSASGGGAGGSGASSVMFPVEIKVTGELTGLRLGSTVKAKVILQDARNALTVPSSALLDAPMPVGASSAGDAGDEGESVPSNSGAKPSVVLDPGAPPEAREEAKNPSVAGAAKPAGPSNPNAPKSVLVLENVGSKTPTIKEVKVKVLVEGASATAIEGSGIGAGTKILNNPMQYMHLIGLKAPIVDTPLPESSAGSAPQG